MMPAARQLRATRPDWRQAAGVAAALFALYALTAPRTVALEDDGLFVLSSYFLGIEHPPGFPLFTLIGHLFTQLPFGSVAYRVHLASAFFGALSCGLLWLCARALAPGRLPAYLAALGLGFSPAFWSQALIAEVYTLNSFFFLLLTYLGLRACPPGSESPNPRLLPWLALVFGLSLSNHWPLMGLAAPAFAVLVWPLRREMLARLGLISWLVIAGLLPYAWLVYRSWMAVPISFYGPLETLTEIWFFLSRAGYGEVDVQPGAGWLDRLKFLQFVVVEVGRQFAVAGALLGVVGVALQRRTLGTRVTAFLVAAFLMPTAVLVLLLGFSYDSVSKHVFHVYPLPAYALVALWAAIGFAWLRERLTLRPAAAAAACAGVLAAILAVGGRYNLGTDHEWGARYAQVLARTLPRDAVLFVKGELDIGPIGYFHMVEGLRPDITLYQSKGLVLGNRLFHPLRTSDATAGHVLREFIETQQSELALTGELYLSYAHRHRWLYHVVDKSSRDPKKVTIDIPEEAVRFFEERILAARDTNAWIAYHQNELRRRYARLLAQGLRRGAPLDERSQRHLAELSEDYHGALGLAEGLMANPEGYAPGLAYATLERARALMPLDALKAEQSKFFYLRGLLRQDYKDTRGALEDLRLAVELWPHRDNPAVAPLEDLASEAQDRGALEALLARVRLPRP
jgi:hypothetical protein